MVKICLNRVTTGLGARQAAKRSYVSELGVEGRRERPVELCRSISSIGYRYRYAVSVPGVQTRYRFSDDATTRFSILFRILFLIVLPFWRCLVRRERPARTPV